MTRPADAAPAPPGQRDDRHDGLRFRAAGPDDLHACWEIWRDALNDYMLPLNLPPIPIEADSITRLHQHLRSTDPDRFVVATRQAEDGGEHIVGFTSAIRRGDLWFLSMLFVRPAEQGVGVGRALLERVLPKDGAILATATDTAQPISNALYTTLGIVPRMPLFSLIGRPGRDGGFDPLPAGVVAAPLSSAAYGSDDRIAAVVDAVDHEVLGFAHREDHRFVALEGRHGFVYRDAADAIVGYGFASEVGRVGPVAVRDEALLAPILGHLLEAIVPRGASAVWVPGAAGGALGQLLRAGFRFEGFPVLLCWTRPFADFGRYLPISPGLL
jgi:GNAT superfamily N-acetyltransferase